MASENKPEIYNLRFSRNYGGILDRWHCSVVQLVGAYSKVETSLTYMEVCWAWGITKRGARYKANRALANLIKNRNQKWEVEELK